jgi:XRE family aerobic/anaerobic benzoate catabolism transcriptional regulator
MDATSPKSARGENASLLKAIGARVRNERAKRGMTRKMLAAQCQTSERYLAQIETGSGNPSVLVLQSIARAFDLDPVDLLPPGRVRPAHIHGAPDRAQRIALIGLRGAGKSTLGGLLAERLGIPFIELDKIIEREHGARVSELFEVYGQATFRRYERDALTRVIAANPAAIIATAGGIAADETTFAQLLDRTHVIWLQASPGEHMRRVREQGDFRPMSHNPTAMDDLVAILDARAPTYGRAHAQLDTSGKAIEASVEELGRIASELFARE